MFVVYNRYIGAVHKTNPGALAEACKFEESVSGMEREKGPAKFDRSE